MSAEIETSGGVGCSHNFVPATIDGWSGLMCTRCVERREHEGPIAAIAAVAHATAVIHELSRRVNRLDFALDCSRLVLQRHGLLESPINGEPLLAVILRAKTG